MVRLRHLTASAAVAKMGLAMRSRTRSLPTRGKERMSTENQRALKRRRQRRVKIRKLLMRLEKPTDGRDRSKTIEKLWRINPRVIPAEALEKR